MKLLTLILILAIAAQPLQAGFCGMDIDQGQAADSGMSMDMDHSDGHGCCDPDESEQEDSCEGGSHCGFCTSISPLMYATVRMPVSWHSSYSFDAHGGNLLPSHSTPPYRPPIA